MLPIYAYYAAWLLGASLLIADLADVLRARDARVALWRTVAAITASFVTLAPAVAHLTGQLGMPPGFNGFVATYFVGGGLYLWGVLAADRPNAECLRRGAYMILLVLGLLPSWVLIGFTPAIGLAGIGLVRRRPPTAG